MKIDVDEKALEIQILRNRYMVDPKRTKTPKELEELEINRLFFWIVSNCQYRIAKANAIRPIVSDSPLFYSIRVEEIGTSCNEELIGDGATILKDYKGEKYYSFFVRGKEFHNVMQEVTKIFKNSSNCDASFYCEKNVAVMIVDIYACY